MASEDKPKKQKKTRDLLLNISAALNVDGQQLAGELGRFATIFQGAVAAAVLNNICKYCGASMTKAANIYIKRNVIPKIVRHPNLDFRKNKNLRGALGVPERYNYKKVEKYLLRVLVLEVTACGKNVDLFKYLKGQSRSDAKARKDNNLQIKSGKAFAGNRDVYLTNNLDKFAEKAYRETSFRTGGQRNIGRRDWLREADLGETDVSGYDVYELREEDKSAEKIRYSRSGTHIMIESDNSYDPNEWRPKPGETHIIQKTFLEMIPGIVDRVRKTIPKCLRRLKPKIKVDVAANVAAATPKAKKRNVSNTDIVDIAAANKVASFDNKTVKGEDLSEAQVILSLIDTDFDAAIVRLAENAQQSVKNFTNFAAKLASGPEYGNDIKKFLRESLLRQR